MLKPRALIIAGDGINCEHETARAFTLAGADSTIMHINDWLTKPSQLFDYQLLGLPGGFSYGDYLGAGTVMALKIKQGAYEELLQFIANGKAVIGICNGLQILLRLGLLPGGTASASITLAANSSATFIDKWVGMHRPQSSTCIWTSLLPDQEVMLPIRHGEGRFVFSEAWQGKGVETLLERGQISLQYTADVNGSAGNITGISNERGTVFGLMPHPECDSKLTGNGLAIFRGGVVYSRES